MWELVFILIAIVLSFVFVIWTMCLKQDKITNRWWTCISITLTLFGIAIAIADEYLSQYAYNPCTIMKYENYRKKGVSFEDLLKTKYALPPEYIFVVDVSGSMDSKQKKKVPLTESLSKQLEFAKKGRLRTRNYDFGITKDKKVPFDKAMKIKLLNSLAQLEKLDYFDNSINYSIVYFDEDCKRHSPLPSLPLKNRIDSSYDDVLERDFDGTQTNFVELFNYLYNEYFAQYQTQNSSRPHRNLFGKKDYIALLFTDYKNDIKDKDRYTIEKELDSIITKIEDSNVNLTLFVVKDEDNQIDSTLIIKLLKGRLSESSFQMLDIREPGNAFDYPIVSRAPIPFYYSNRIFEDSLRTSMFFDLDNSKLLSFRLVNNSQSNRQEFRLYRQGEKKPFRMSVNKNKIHIRQNDKIEFEIFGYIPAPYESPDIVVEDASTGIHYVFPVVFYKKLPPTVMVLMFVILIIYSYMLYYKYK